MDEQEQGELVLTYAELATKLGVSPDGARTRAKRAGWPVIPGNDGRSRVRVRVAELPQLPRSQAEQIPEQTGSMNALLAELRRAYGEHSAELIARAEKAEQQTEQWRSQAEQDRAAAEHERAVAELLRDQLAREQRRAEDLAAELRDVRRPWLVRVLAPIRR
jgi:predicted RNase H-like nuclease (RuvC/YqgF family)